MYSDGVDLGLWGSSGLNLSLTAAGLAAAGAATTGVCLAAVAGRVFLEDMAFANEGLRGPSLRVIVVMSVVE